MKNEHTDSLSAVIFVQRLFILKTRSGPSLHGFAHSLDSFQIDISWKAPADGEAQRNDWNEKDNDDEANVTGFDFECLQGPTT